MRKLEAEFGKVKTAAILQSLVDDQMAKALKTKSTTPKIREEFEKIKKYEEQNALDVQVLANTPGELAFQVTRCAYVELMKELGAQEWGELLICNYDFAGAIKDGMTLVRKNTCMGGYSFCDLHFGANPKEYS